MTPKPTLSEAHILDSVAGEEDPGASLDVVRNLIAAEREKHKPATPASTHPLPPRVRTDRAEGDKTPEPDPGASGPR
jgi:hypothetical protein